MCGIVGLAKAHSSVDPEFLIASVSVLANRGPDDSGIWASENVGLGHRRLAIIDLSPSGHQPMRSADGRYVIVFNGEIYNYQELRTELESEEASWQGNSDTEVILAAYARWGTGCVERFDGMFAFAIWDRKERVLFAARDRMGEKPFFYHCAEGNFAFASRPNALFRLLPELSDEFDIQAIRYYIEAGHVPTPYSIYRSVRKLPPAHWLVFKGGQLHIERYWDFRHISPEPGWNNRGQQDLLDELDEITSRSVRNRMVSDVPLGAFLSGGIDSSLIVALMARISPRPIKTFTIGFEGTKYDESPHAAAVSQALNTEHSCEHMRINDLLEMMPIYFREYDDPFADSSGFPTLAVSRAARKHVTVSLSGDGGDELFGGYPYYPMVDHLETFFLMPGELRKIAANLTGMIPRHRFKLLSAALRRASPAEVFCFARSFTKDFENVLVREAIEGTTSLLDFLMGVVKSLPAKLSAADQAMRMDAFCTLHDDYLQKVDVGSMAFSLESRAPFLDHRVVEWSMRLPLAWKLRQGTTKYLLRHLAYRYVPRKILDRPKKGFEVPLADWLRGPLYAWAKERFEDRDSFERLPLNQKSLIELLELHRSGRRNVHPLLWAALVLLQFSITASRHIERGVVPSIQNQATAGVF